MVVTILIDNLSKDDLICEWGLAIHIAYQGHSILLDTGASEQFIQNAAALQLDLEAVEYGVLSHAHYDHSDGMGAFFAHNRKAKFYVREGTWENCYDDEGKGNYRYIGIQKGLLSAYQDRIVYVKGDHQLLPGVYLIPHKTPGLAQKGKQAHMCIRQGALWLEDDFSHEQSLVMETERGLVIFNSCSHGGADVIISEVAKTFPGQKIYAFVGGFHLFEAEEETVRQFAGRLKKTGVEKIVTGHCTGEQSFAVLKEELGDAAVQLYTGMTLEL